PTLDATSSDATSGVSSVDFGYTGAGAGGAIATVAGTGAPGASAAYDTDWVTGGLPDGTYTVSATSSDKASNSASSNQTVVVDNTPPSATLDDPGAYGHGPLALTVTASDAASGVDAAATVVQSAPHGTGAWTAIANATAWTPADGTYDLRAIVSDNVGNQTTTATRTITIDSTPPTVTDDADSAWHAGDVIVNLGAADAESGVASVQYKVDAGSFTTGTSVVVPAPSDGSNDGIHTITYRATNRAGVTSSNATTTVRIDHTPPSNVSLDTPAPGAFLHGTLAGGDLAATAQDAASGVASTTFRLAPAGTLAANPCATFGMQISAPFDTASVSDGHYDLWVAAVDTAGNGRCSVVPHDVVIDNTAPVTTDNAPAGAQNHDVSVNLGATDNLAGVAETDYSLDGGSTWLPGTTVVIPAPSDGSNDGSHTVEYRSRDNAGNVETAKSFQVTIDTTAPAGNATDPGSVLSGTVQLTASPTATDVASVQFLERPAGSLSAFTPIGTNSVGAPWQVPWLTNGVADGTYDIEVVVTDQAGNSSTQLLSSKIVDNTAPDLAAVTAPGAAADVGGIVPFAAVAHDATSGVGAVVFQVQWSGASGFTTVDADTSAPYTGSWNSAGVPDGPAQVRVAVTDVAGNGPIYSSPVSFTVDNTAPTVVLSAPPSTNAGASLSATGTADIQSVTYAYSPHAAGTWTAIGTVSSPFATSWATASLPEGAYDVRAIATDGGGNAGTDVSTVLVDRTSPTATLIQPANGTTVGGTSVALVASASDDSAGVASVVFGYRPNGSIGAYTAIATPTSAPYAAAWDTSALASGDYQVRALVTDKAGNTYATNHVMTVDSTPPVVTSLNVATAVSGTVTPSVSTNADATSVTYELSPAGSNTWTQVATSSSAPHFPGSFNSASLADGLYDVRAVVRDAFGNATTVVVGNVQIDNTPPTLLASTPADGSLLASLSSVSATASEPLSAISSLQLDGGAPSFTATISGAGVSFPTGVLADGNHYLTGKLIDLAGNSKPFRINFTVLGGTPAGGVPPTSKNVSSSLPTTLEAADNSAAVTVPANVWNGPAPAAQDFLVLKIDPSPPPSIIPTATLALTSTVVDVTMFWSLSQTAEHAFDAPIEIDLTDPSGTNGTPATAEPGSAWRAIPALAQAGQLPLGQPDGYWRTGATIHILTRHLSLFTVLTGAAANVPLATPLAVDAQVPAVARSSFAFTIATAPRSTMTKHSLIGRALATTTARIDVTLDAYPYHRLQRWHFFHVRPGATILRLPLRPRLRPGLYRVFWKATSDADHTVARRITPLRILGHSARTTPRLRSSSSPGRGAASPSRSPSSRRASTKPRSTRRSSTRPTTRWRHSCSTQTPTA
ncbi:MAG TPA: Ig-like domain-containing protein, partial [Gaiellaceae bacterium]|nr:Ig-like domain-containing protein [Gaiellaceae bacterium]